MVINLVPAANNYSIIIHTTVLKRKEERKISKIKYHTYMTSIFSFCHGMTASDLSYDKYILWVRDVSKTQVNNWKPSQNHNEQKQIIFGLRVGCTANILIFVYQKISWLTLTFLDFLNYLDLSWLLYKLVSNKYEGLYSYFMHKNVKGIMLAILHSYFMVKCNYS